MINKILLFLLMISLSVLFTACGGETKNVEGKKSSEGEIEMTDGDDDTFYADVLRDEVAYITDDQAELVEESYSFIVQNPNIFPAKTKEDIERTKELSEDIDLKLLNKNLKPYYSTITSFKGYVVQIEEENYDNGETAAFINVLDDEWNNHHVILFKSTEDILEEDYVEFTGLPIAKYNYSTLDGGSQNTILFFGSHIEKH